MDCQDYMIILTFGKSFQEWIILWLLILRMDRADYLLYNSLELIISFTILLVLFLYLCFCSNLLKSDLGSVQCFNL